MASRQSDSFGAKPLGKAKRIGDVVLLRFAERDMADTFHIEHRERRSQAVRQTAAAPHQLG